MNVGLCATHHNGKLFLGYPQSLACSSYAFAVIH